jgi:hypothetical protein
MENKKVLTLLLATLLILVLVSVLAFGKRNLNSNLDIQESSTDTAFVLSLADIIAQNIPQKCTFSYEDEFSKSISETWIKNGKIKQVTEIQIQSADNKTTNLISDGTYFYIWEEGSNTGMKMKLEEPNGESVEGEESQVDVDLNEKLEYKCSPEPIDDSLFDLPEGVVFTDWGEEVKNIEEQMQDFDINELEKYLPQGMGE